MWLAELLAGLLHGFGDLVVAGSKGRRVVIAMMVVIAVIVAYVVLV